MSLSFRMQVRIMGPNFVPGTKKDLYVKVRIQTALPNASSIWASASDLVWCFRAPVLLNGHCRGYADRAADSAVHGPQAGSRRERALW